MIAVSLAIALFGAIPDKSPTTNPTINGYDTTPALNAAATQACATGEKVIEFGAGQYAFYTAPAPFPCGVTLKGVGSESTLLVQAYSRDTSLYFLVWAYGGGGGIVNATPFAWHGVQGGIGVYVSALPTSAPGDIAGAQVWRDAIVSGFGSWWYPAYLDGSQRTNCAAACGIRSVRFDNVRIFQGSTVNVVCNNCIAFEWFGGGSYGAAAAVQFYGAQSSGNYINANVQGAITGPGVKVGR